MDKPRIQPTTQTILRPSPTGPLPPRRSLFPGTGALHLQLDDSITAPATEQLSPELPASEAAAEPVEDPFSPGVDSPPRRHSAAAAPFDPLAQPLAFLSGGVVALLTLLVPLSSVLTDRRHLSERDTIPAPPGLPFDESAQPGHLNGSGPQVPQRGSALFLQ